MYNFEGFSLECNPRKGINSRVYNFEGFSLECNPGKGIKSGDVSFWKGLSSEELNIIF